MPLSLDHLVIHVSHLQTAITDYQALGFQVQVGGTHADGSTHNALIGFADGSYLELISFLKPAPGHRWSHHHAAGYEGFIDFALLPDRVGEVVSRAQASGLAYQGPLEGGRLRPDGQRLEWQIGVPPSSDLPFLCGDVTPRALRVPEGDVRVHPNGAQGIASLTLAVADLAQSLKHYRVLLDAEPTQPPQALSGLGIVQATIALGRTELILLSPLRGAETATAHDLRQRIATRGAGLLGATLWAHFSDAADAVTHALPIARTHGAHLALSST